jgi:mono/diheme cytochrome c family protein
MSRTEQIATLRRHLPSSTLAIALLLVVVGCAGGFVYSGAYDIGADAPHWRVVYGMLDEFRDRAIVHHARGVAVPHDLNSARRVGAGAALYSEMCTGCHLAPGINPTELSKGLYPAAPELARGDGLSAAEQFWVIKHGVKLSAMPAWGKTHNDQLIWDLVAFIRKMRGMNEQQFEAAVASAPEDHDEMMEHMSGSKGDVASAPQGR